MENTHRRSGIDRRRHHQPRPRRWAAGDLLHRAGGHGDEAVRRAPAERGLPAWHLGAVPVQLELLDAKQVALARCCDLGELHWATVFAAAVENGASVGTLSAIARTLGALMTFGMHHDYFQSEPFGPARMRRDVVRATKQAATSRDGDSAAGITIDLCPDGAEISEYADAFEALYAGYGRRLVLLAFHCGARIMELAALRADDLGPDQLTVAIGAQLDRDRPWPATRLPKNHKPRVADLWGIGEDNVRSLIAGARTGRGRTPARCSRRCQASRTGLTSSPTWPPRPPGPAAGRTPGPFTGPGTPTPPTASRRSPLGETIWKPSEFRTPSATRTPPSPSGSTYRSCPATRTATGRSRHDPQASPLGREVQWPAKTGAHQRPSRQTAARKHQIRRFMWRGIKIVIVTKG